MVARAGITFNSKPSETHYIPLSKLNLCNFGKFSNPYGHFKKGDYVLIEDRLNSGDNVFCPDKDRTYFVPKGNVKLQNKVHGFDPVIEVPWMEDLMKAYDEDFGVH